MYIYTQYICLVNEQVLYVGNVYPFPHCRWESWSSGWLKEPHNELKSPSPGLFLLSHLPITGSWNNRNEWVLKGSKYICDLGKEQQQKNTSSNIRKKRILYNNVRKKIKKDLKNSNKFIETNVDNLNESDFFREVKMEGISGGAECNINDSSKLEGNRSEFKLRLRD